MTEPIKVGVAAIIRRGDKVLMGLRKGAHGAGTWCLPGGHLEPGETVERAAQREVREETGLVLAPSRFHKIAYTDDWFEIEKLRYITLYVEVEPGPPGSDQEPEVLEPHKCQEWMWARHAPGTLFLPLRNLLREQPGVVWPTH